MLQVFNRSRRQFSYRIICSSSNVIGVVATATDISVSIAAAAAAIVLQTKSIQNDRPTTLEDSHQLHEPIGFAPGPGLALQMSVVFLHRVHERIHVDIEFCVGIIRVFDVLPDPVAKHGPVGAAGG